MTDRIKSLQTLYDARALTYDPEAGFHPHQAADYLKWMSLSPARNVLDLACGTGAITIPAARAVGPSVIVFGVDISPASLSIARDKATNQGLGNATFVEHDIEALHEVKEIDEGMFDVITCASAFVLLADPGSAVESWAKLLKKRGRLIFDVPTNDSMIPGLMLDKVAQQLGIPVVYDRTTLGSKEKVIQLLTGAGMDSSESFLVGDYKELSEVLEIDGEKAGEVWDAMVAQRNWFTSWYMGLTEPGVEKTEKEVFCRELKKIAGPDAKVREQMRFHMAVGRKV